VGLRSFYLSEVAAITGVPRGIEGCADANRNNTPPRGMGSGLLVVQAATPGWSSPAPPHYASFSPKVMRQAEIAEQTPHSAEWSLGLSFYRELLLTKVATAEIATQTPRLASEDLGLSF
jgi:hypothetical protein